MTPAPDEEPPPPRIELEPLHLRDVPRYERYTPPPHGPMVDTGPVPQKPEHRCPTCDYILAGLTSRRCPECGEPFTILEARMRGIEMSEGMQEAMQGDRVDQIKRYVGLVLMIFSVLLKNIMANGWSWMFYLSSRGFLMLIFMVPLWIGVISFKVIREEGWPYACWVAGLVAILMSGILAII